MGGRAYLHSPCFWCGFRAQLLISNIASLYDVNVVLVLDAILLLLRNVKLTRTNNQNKWYERIVVTRLKKMLSLFSSI